MTAADAIAALRAAGHCVTRTTRADAARRYGCQTALYVINGRGHNLGGLRAKAQALGAQAPEASRPVLPGELTPPPAPTPHGAAAPELPRVAPPALTPRQGPGVTVAELRQDAAAGRVVSLATLSQALGHSLGLAQGGRLPCRRPAVGDALAGQPWDPGTPAARAAVAVQGERAGILWPVAQALRGEGVTLPPAWHSDGPALNGEWPVARALAALTVTEIAMAAAALAALPPVTAAQDAALTLCRTGAVPGRPYL